MDSDDSTLFSSVEGAVISAYHHLKPKGDIDNSVLAAFLLHDSSSGAFTVLSLATGTKVMSGDLRAQTAPIGAALLHDCHAEVLARRALHVWLWEHLSDSDVFDSSGALHPHLSLLLYTSAPPCGDCGVHCAGGEVSVQTGAKPFGAAHADLLRTPPNVVRGKPGRGPRAQSVSCSDKISVWLACGVGGALLANFARGLRIAAVAVGGGRAESVARALRRCGGAARVCVGESAWAQANASPSAAALAWWAGAQRAELIAGKCGRRLGVAPKRQTESGFYSRLCDAAMLARYAERAGVRKVRLGEAKRRCAEYRAAKERARERLVKFGGAWAQKFPEEAEWTLDEDAEKEKKKEKSVCVMNE